MADNSVPLTVVSNPNNSYYWAQIGIGKNILTQQPSQGGYWFVVIDRSNLNVVYNQFQTAPNVAPNLGNYNTTSYILVAATVGVGLNNVPQGALFNFLDVNGGGMQLRRVEQVGTQLSCGSLGTFGYALVGVLGNLNTPGFEGSLLAAQATGPILTVQLLPIVVNNQTVYTPVELSNA
jgi:hypothetical protein